MQPPVEFDMNVTKANLVSSIDQTPNAASRYHTCAYCEHATFDLVPSNRVPMQPKSGLKRFVSRQSQPSSSWAAPLLQIPIDEARKATEAGCLLFRYHPLPDSMIRLMDDLTMILGSPVSKWLPPLVGNLDPRSVRSLDFARRCLSECLKTHKKCNPIRVLLQPSRLLDIASPRSATDTIVLVRPEEGVTYTVLSYCWGGGVGFKTTTCTLAYAETGLGLSEVPQTIQDAVFVALELRLRYIWIDRLRIVQDDYEEFSKEIQKMHDIYAGARVNITAGSAASSQDGFLHPFSRSIALCIPMRYPTGE
ncbi:hypothetical protein L207DRAFT_571933 [Hyaloscypha variabilis F]|uniref:Heterokaryon incompatibility domain-containing protein n=1 Tax=Hyaloscypha variabilis (strain UAMH 11265 / GT02V1 / F) TaxID=1149755 RepID=A0A2J6R293_HYAVF|nr:hypothetical protein L207DRAFT_571933 [Hyaloscypha variabilis F]